MTTIIQTFILAALLLSQSVFANHDLNNAQFTGVYPFGPGTVVKHDHTRNVYFVATGGGVLIMDYSQPTNPVVVNDSIAGSDQIGDIEFDSATNRLYVAAVDLFIWDVSDINNPVQLGVLAHSIAGLTNFSVRRLSLEGNTLFSVAGTRLHAIDVSNPTNPALMHTYTVTSSGIGGLSVNLNDLASKGSLVFVTGTQADMRIFNYSPVTGFSFLHSTGWNVAESRGPLVHGNYLYYYTSSFEKGLAIMDISSRDKFSIFSMPSYPDYATVDAIEGNIAFVSRNLPGVTTAQVDIVDITDQFNFAPVSSMFFDSLVVSLGASTNQIAVITKYNDLQIFDYNDLAAPALAGSYVLDGVSIRVNLSGSLALLAQPYSGIQVIDLSDPAQPARKSTIAPLEFTMDAVGQGNLVYVVDKRLIRIFDASDASTPSLLGEHTLTPQQASDTSLSTAIAVNNNIAIANVLNEVEIVDVSQSNNPQLLSRYTARDWVRRIRIYGNLAYICTGAGLEIVDISNPAAPREAGFFAVRFNQDTVLQGNLAYAISALDGLYILDVSNIANIKQVGFYNVSGTINAINVKGDYAFVADTYTGVQTINVSNPSDPQRVGLYVDKNVRDLELLDNYYVTAGNHVGLKVVENLLDNGSGGGGDPGPRPDPAPNQAPIAKAGLDQTVGSRNNVTLNGTASSDPDGDTITYQWTQISGSNVSLSNASSATPTFRAPRTRRDKVLEFKLTVTDDGGLSSSDTVTITVTN